MARILHNTKSVPKNIPESGTKSVSAKSVPTRKSAGAVHIEYRQNFGKT